jgi:hypothetical protein
MSVVLVVTQHIRARIHENDHNPPHVHVTGPGGAEAIFKLNGLELDRLIGFTRSDLKMIEEFLTANLDTLKEHWNEIHGKKD